MSPQSFSSDAEAAAAALRLSVRGLTATDATLLQQVLSGDTAECRYWAVAHDECHALVVDLRTPDALDVLRERALGTVVILALDPGDAALPGTLSLSRPFRDVEVRATLAHARAVIARRSEAIGPRGRRSFSEDWAPATHGDPQSPSHYRLTTLRELAGNFRDTFLTQREVIVRVEGRAFQLFPQRGTCWSDHRSEVLAQFRGRSPVVIEVEIPVLSSEQRQKANGRLTDFAWCLGFHAGNGQLLPWLSADSLYRLTRWPPLIGQPNGSRLFQAAAQLSRGAHAPVDVVRLTNVAGAAVNDFLNACSLVGCLESGAAARSTEEFRPPSGAATLSTPTGVSTVPSVQRSLLIRIRQRMGIAS